jgi:hypothetical protein
MDRVARALFPVLLLAIGYVALRANIENISFSDYVAYGKAVNSDTPIVSFDERKITEMANTCRTDIFGPGMRLRLWRLSLANRVKDNENWSNAAAAADDFLTASIRCAPYRGDSWVRSAMVAQTIAEDPGRLTQILTQAYYLNPFEGSQVVARLSLWSKVSDETRRLSGSIIASDVNAILQHGSKSMMTSLLKSSSVYIRELALKERDNLPDDRKIIVRRIISE